MNLYRSTQPHAGFQILKRWADKKRLGAFIYTSNVDGHFQKAGFAPERIDEIHGSVHWMQCTRHCGIGIFPADEFTVQIDETTMRALEPLPQCPQCGNLARPNILMFDDGDWEDDRERDQRGRLLAWLDSLHGELVVVECGAGTAIPSVRLFCERLSSSRNVTLLRINPRDPQTPPGAFSFPMGSLEALRLLDRQLAEH